MSDTRDIIQTILGIKSIKAHHRLREELGAESLDIQNILSALEDRYLIQFDEDDLDRLETVQDLETLVDQKNA